MKRRKTVRKDESIRIRVTPEQKDLLNKAAEDVGIGLSAWLLSTGLRAAKEL